jgi:hypothetical protein
MAQLDGCEIDPSPVHFLPLEVTRNLFVLYWSALADDFRTFLLNPDIFELALSAV